MKMSKAFAEIDQERDKIIPNSVKRQAPDYSGTVYLYHDKSGNACALYFAGRAMKHSGHYRYHSVEERDLRVNEWLSAQQARREKRQAKKRELQVGDVLRCSWGYEQTNVDYYKVTALIGKSSVEIVEIAQHREDQGRDMGTCIPDPEKVIGEPMRKRVDGDTVKISSFQWARKVKTTTLPGGVKVFDADRWTAYY